MSDGKIIHTGWDHDDYDTESLGTFTPIDPGDGVDWSEVLDRTRQRLADLPPERDRTPHERRVARDLRQREEAVEAHLEAGDDHRR